MFNLVKFGNASDSGFRAQVGYTMVKRHCQKYPLLNWKNSPQFSGAYRSENLENKYVVLDSSKK